MYSIAEGFSLRINTHPKGCGYKWFYLVKNDNFKGKYMALM